MNSKTNVFSSGLRTILAVTACVGISACSSPRGEDAGRGLRAKVFTVAISALDWVEITYVPSPGNSVFPNPCRLSLMGSGEIEFRTGRSPLVWDSFSQKIDDPNWNDLWTDRVHLGQEEMQSLYQELVDAGVFPAFSWRADVVPRQAPFAKVNARIGQHRALRTTDDQRIVRLIERVLSNFSGTAGRVQSRIDRS